jgi:hypothetical protein
MLLRPSKTTKLDYAGSTYKHLSIFSTNTKFWVRTTYDEFKSSSLINNFTVEITATFIYSYHHMK